MKTTNPADFQHACTVLSSPALIRLITEIDDNGPIPVRQTARILADLPVDDLRQATDMARAGDLVSVRPGAGLSLTTAGEELADVYDTLARWARRHAYPAPVSDFTGRIRHTLALLATAPVATGERGVTTRTDVLLPSAEAARDLARPHDLLQQWLEANPQLAGSAEQSELAA
ncbi:hypothetical protein AQI95_29085 [Streptomyces yokosukanensis]|uniref:HTH hxlR-type domain-containing protein n=1 Tax=Streptomyces yokosukanensis TaxID=67386 RepID=A0A124HEY1_9ACTN|nr:hypothetical protein [Streptomyces yokosukanensis]KUN02128.1 hypothetical protein AQI95_29085 [Streptomyces yokosukanensis]